MEIPSDWLVKRAEGEVESMKSKKPSLLFASRRELVDIERQISKSLGKVEMIKEIMDKFNTPKEK